MEGDAETYRHPVSEPLPDHGPAWPDPGKLPITVDVEVEPEPEGPPAPTAPAGTPRVVAPPPPSRTLGATPPGEPSSTPPEPRTTPPEVREEPEMEVLMDLPDVVPPPETRAPSIPPPPRYRPPDIKVPEPPAHREMDVRSPPAPPSEEGPEVVPQEPSTSPQTGTPSAQDGPVPAPPPSDEWELEELPRRRMRRSDQRPRAGGTGRRSEPTRPDPFRSPIGPIEMIPSFDDENIYIPNHTMDSGHAN